MFFFFLIGTLLRIFHYTRLLKSVLLLFPASKKKMLGLRKIAKDLKKVKFL